MRSYYVYAWTDQLKGEARERTEKAIRAIDEDAGLVVIDRPGNQKQMWLYRPNDGTNDYSLVRAQMDRCIEIVNVALNREES